MRSAVAAVLFAVIAVPAARAADGPVDPKKEEWVSLFDGKSLDGWTPKIAGYPTGENFANTFRVENGVLKVSYDGYGGAFRNRFGHLFYKMPFSHYRLVVEYRFVGRQMPDGPEWAFKNSGIMVHGQPASTMGKDQDFPISIEVQLLGGRPTGERTTANLCTPGTNVVMNGKLVTDHCVTSTSPTFRGEEWVTAEVEAHGAGRIVHRIDGQVVLSYEKPQYGGGNVNGHDPSLKKDGELIEKGSISLQSESHPVEFRKVEILNLVGCMDEKAKNYRSYFEKADPKSCRY
ncbi:MAG: DUF1080 domain-containing protein [Vicinamibacteria bacterium]